MTENLPNSTYEGSVKIAGVVIDCYQLDDGRRIMDMQGVNQLLSKLADGYHLSDEEVFDLAALKEGRTVMERKP